MARMELLGFSFDILAFSCLIYILEVVKENETLAKEGYKKLRMIEDYIEELDFYH